MDENTDAGGRGWGPIQLRENQYTRGLQGSNSLEIFSDFRSYELTALKSDSITCLVMRSSGNMHGHVKMIKNVKRLREYYRCTCHSLSTPGGTSKPSRLASLFLTYLSIIYNLPIIISLLHHLG